MYYASLEPTNNEESLTNFLNIKSKSVYVVCSTMQFFVHFDANNRMKNIHTNIPEL